MTALVLGLAAALVLMPRASRADDDQPTIISAQGDARARASSPEALVSTKPALPPGSAPPVIPSEAVPVTARIGASASSPARTSAFAAVPAPTMSAPQTSPTSAEANPAPKMAPPPAAAESRPGRFVLIAFGTILAFALFFWERRTKD